jgi:hypothetical protein
MLLKTLAIAYLLLLALGKEFLGFQTVIISYKTMMGLHFIVTLIVLGIAIRFQTGMETITQITEEHIS